MRFSGLLCGIRAKICSEKTWLKFVAMSAFNIPSPCPLPQEGGEVRAAALDLLRGFAPQPRSGLLCGINGGYRPKSKQGCLQSATQSHYARTHNDSHTKPLHDATAQMAVNAQMQWHKWLTTCTGAPPLRPHF